MRMAQTERFSRLLPTSSLALTRVGTFVVVHGQAQVAELLQRNLRQVELRLGIFHGRLREYGAQRSAKDQDSENLG